MACSPWPDRSRPKRPATSTIASDVPDTLASKRRRARAFGFLEHQIVALQAERIADKLERDVIIAAELELGERIELALGQFGREFDLAGREHVGRAR